MTENPQLGVQRVRHPLKLRHLTVRRVQPLSPHMVCVTFTGDDLADFVSASFDDHVKLMLPAADGTLNLPVMPGAAPTRAAAANEAAKSLMRDYTPRRYDTVAAELDIHFALHGHGPASAWAAQAAPGQVVGVGGPRGSFVVPTAFDWHLLVGDASALPAIARRLEELPATTRAIAVIELDAADRPALNSAAALSVHWVPPDGMAAAEASPLVREIERLRLPPGEGYAWAAGEAKVIRVLRQSLLTTHGLPRERVPAAAYWRRGSAAFHETLDD